MQKKVLLSLMAAAPVAFSVSAHENVTLDNLLMIQENNDNWKYTGIPTLTFGNNQVTATQPGTSAYLMLNEVWTTVKGGEMPAGYYKIKFDVLETAIIKINGEEFTNGSEYSYQGGEFKIEITNSVNGHEYTFGQGHLELRFNFQAEQADLNAQLDALTAKVVELTEQNPENPDNVSPVYQQLVADRTNIMDQINDVKDTVKTINLNATDPIPGGKTTEEYYLDIYTTYQFYANPNVIQSTINSLDEVIEDFNGRAKAENERYGFQEANQDNLDTVLASFAEYTEWKDGFKFEDAPEYVQDKCKESWKELEAKESEVDGLITSTFFDADGKIKDDALVDYSDLTDAITELNNLKTAFENEFNAASADFNAYNQWYQANVSLDKYKADIMEELKAIADNEENQYNGERVYTDMETQAGLDLQQFIDDARTEFTIKDAEIEGAADKLEFNLALVNGAKSNMDEYKANFETKVATQEAALDTANAAAEDARTKLNEVKKTIVEAEMSENGYKAANAKVTEIEGLIDAEQDKIDKEYMAHELDSSDYDFSEILTAIDQLTTSIDTDKANKEITDANNKWITNEDETGLRDKYNDLLETIALAFPEDGELGHIFDTTTANIDASITAFEELIDTEYNGKHRKFDENSTDYQQYTDIVKNIADTKGFVQPLKDAYDKCDTSLDAMNGVVVGLEDIFNKKQQVKDKDGKVIPTPKTDEWIEPFRTELGGYQEALNTITTGLNDGSITPKEAKDQIEILGTQYAEKTEDFENRAEEARIAFDQKYSKSNYETVNNYYLAVTHAFQALGESEYPGKQAVSDTLDSIRELLDEISHTIYGNGTMSDPATDNTVLKGADEECQSVYNSLFEVNGEVAKLKANNDAYKAITTALNNAAAALAEAKDDVSKKTTEPARTLFLEQLDALGKRLEGVTTQAADDYENIDSATKKDDTTAEIASIQNEINNVVNNALENDAIHVTQLNALKELLEDLNGFRTEIEEFDQIESDRQTYLDSLDTVVGKYNLLVTTVADAFAAGASVVNNDDIMANIDSIRAEGQGIVDAMKGSYHQAVVDHNTAVLADSDWDEWVTKLNQEYRNSVDTYNAYHNSLVNTGFREYMGDVITTHESIYSYSTPIRALIDTVNNKIKTEFNDKDLILTPEWIQENAIAEAEEIYNDMTGEVTDMTTAANAKAEEYYQMQLEDATTLVRNAYDTMIQAGVSEERAKEATNAVDKEIGKAKRYHQLGVDGGNLCLLMGSTVTVDDQVIGGIADIFDDIEMNDIDMNAAALSQWNSDYADAVETIDGYLENLSEYVIVTTEYNTQLNEIKASVDALNAEATSPEMDNLIGNLSDLQVRLEELLEQAKNVDDTARKANDDAVAEKEAYEDFTGDIATVNTEFNDLKTWADGMAVEYLQDYTAIDAAIKDATDYIENNKGNLTDPAIAEIAEGKINNAKMLIEGGYEKCYGDEKAALTELDNEARRQYNEMFAGQDLTTGEAKVYGEKLNGVEAEIKALSQTLGTSSDLDEVRTKLLDLQTRLVDIIDEICALRQVESPAVGILADLNKRYGEVSAQIAALFEGIDENVKPEFEEKANGLSTDLDAVKAAYEAEESKNLIAVGNNYDEDMDDISDAATALRAEIEEANTEYLAEKERQAASDAKAVELQAEIDGYQARFDELDAFVKGAGCYPSVESAYAEDAAELQGYIDAMQNWLNAEKGEYALTADSIIPGVAEFESELEYDEGFYSVRESDYQNQRGKDSVNVAEMTVRSAQHVNQEALEETLADLKTRANALNSTYGNMEDVRTLTETVNQLVAEAEALVAEAEATVFILGDINGDKIVDAADLQELVNIIATEDVAQDDPRFMSCDINATGDINVADAVSLANMIFNQNPEDVMMRLASVPDANPIVNIQAVETAAENGTRTIQIRLTNTVAFAAGQFDLKLPAGMSIISESVSERAEVMGMISHDFADGRHRVVLLSETLEEMDGTEGAILELEVSGSGNIYVENAVFSDRYGHSYAGTDPGTTGIEGLINSAVDGATKVYDAAGRVVNKLQKGINIIVNGNGKGKKVMNRK